MRFITFLAFASLGVLSVLSKKLFFEPLSNIENNSNNEVAHWALLVAGSNYWYNYRHQADISHAYQILKKHGIPAERIVTMMYDDLAHSPNNPTPGKIINKPGGPNVYEGVVVDYSKNDVTPANFLAVLRGDEKAMAGKGSGKVIKSGPNDHVFVNFVDHGGPGILGFPHGLLHADDLIKTIKDMHANKQYGQMVVYVEACHAGSMFENLLPEDINVYVTTASNAGESSYACYYDAEYKTYLGDVYSVSWMEDSDVEHFSLETLQKQYQIVKKETETSHVIQFGDEKISEETLDNFQGEVGVEVEKQERSSSGRNCNGVRSEDVPLAILYKRLDHTDDEEEKENIKSEIKQLIWEKGFVEETSRKIVRKVSSMTNHIFDDLYNARHKLNDHECYKAAVGIYTDYCFEVSQNGYAMKSLQKILNMCEANISLDVISRAIKSTCTYSSASD